MLERPPTKAEEEILAAVARYHFATIDQIMLQLNQQESQLRGTQIKLKALVDRGYLSRIDREHTGTTGKLKPVYHLSKKAQGYLRDLGIEATIYKEPGPGQIKHVLAVNSVLLLAQDFASRCPQQIRLIERRHDYELRQWQLSLTPDGFLHFVLTTKEGAFESYPILIEVDRGTESQSTIEDKIKAYVAFTRGEYQRHFRLAACTMAWFVTGAEGRLLNLQDSAEKALKGLRLERLGQFFFLGRLQEEIAADALFTSEHFLVPFAGDQRFPLLAGHA